MPGCSRELLTGWSECLIIFYAMGNFHGHRDRTTRVRLCKTQELMVCLIHEMKVKRKKRLIMYGVRIECKNNRQQEVDHITSCQGEKILVVYMEQ